MKIIEEGKIKLNVFEGDKISKELPVFYNPIMTQNRDYSIRLLNALDKKMMQIGLPLSGSGVRGLRFIKELSPGKIKNISFNDYSSEAVSLIKKNFKLNNLKWKSLRRKKLIDIYCYDANLFLLGSQGFDYIDIDPFGPPIQFLDSAVRRLSRDSVLAITATDTAALSGTYPKACWRKYWSKPLRNYMMHEIGLRILIRRVQLIGMTYDKALVPIFSYSKDHYMRVFFKCEKSKETCNTVFKKQGMLEDAGPMWLGKLWDSKLVDKMKDDDKFLNIIADESKIDQIGFYDIHQICKVEKLSVPKNELLFERIKKKGFKVSRTHFSDKGIRSDIDYKNLVWIIKSLK